MLCFIYSRKSVYTGKGDSIENQVQMCRQYIHQKLPGLSNDDIFVYEDEGFSAKNTNRPRFMQMLQDIRQKRPQYVVCYRLDRISRNVGDFSRLIDELERLGVAFVSIKEEFDTSKPMGKAMLYIASVFAQLERETIAQRVRDNMLELARLGRWLGGTPPTGYKSQTLLLAPNGTAKPKSICVLQQVPQEAALVKQMFALFLERQSLHAVWAQLAKQGVCSRSGKAYSRWGIRQILQNPVYCQADKDAYAYFVRQHADICFAKQDCTGQYGLIAYNKRDYRQNHAPRQSMDKWILAIGRHQGLIAGKQWVCVQNLLNPSAHSAPPRARNQYALLSGALYCQHCQQKMVAKARSSAKSGFMFDYICQTKLRLGARACSCANLNGPQADQQVFAAIAQYLQTLVTPCALSSLRKRQLQRLAEPPQTLCAPAAPPSQLAQLSRYLAQPNLTQNDLLHIQQSLQALIKTQTQPPAAAPHTSDADSAILQDFAAVLGMLSLWQKRALIRQAAPYIGWNSQTLFVHFQKHLPAKAKEQRGV